MGERVAGRGSPDGGAVAARGQCSAGGKEDSLFPGQICYGAEKYTYRAGFAAVWRLLPAFGIPEWGAGCWPDRICAAVQHRSLVHLVDRVYQFHESDYGQVGETG